MTSRKMPYLEPSTPIKRSPGALPLTIGKCFQQNPEAVNVTMSQRIFRDGSIWLMEQFFAVIAALQTKNCVSLQSNADKRLQMRESSRPYQFDNLVEPTGKILPRSSTIAASKRLRPSP